MKHFIFLITACFLTISCSTPQNNDVVDNRFVFIPNPPEVVSSPFEIYNSMARAAKYNINNAVLEHDRKELAFLEASTTQEKLNVFGVGEKSQDTYSAYKKLATAIMIAEQTNYQYMVKNLMLAGVEVYNNGYFAKNESINLRRYEAQKQKELNKLKGIDNPSELDHENIEALEVFLLKASKMQEKYANDMARLDAVDVVDVNKISFGSKKYFEMTNFRPEFSLERFENLAVSHKIIKDIRKAKNILASNYINAYRLDMSDNAFKNKPLKTEVIYEADGVAVELLDKKVSLDVARLMQIKLAYYITKLSSFEYEDANNKYLNAYKNYNKALKNKDDVKNILEAKANLIETDYNKNTALSRFAVAAQNLYFLTLPFYTDCDFLNRAVGLIGKEIRKYIITNKTELLATKKPKNPREVKEMPAQNLPKHWAPEGTDWIEDVVGEPSVVPEGVQIGAFYEFGNAQKMANENPNTKVYSTKVNNKTIYRVIEH